MYIGYKTARYSIVGQFFPDYKDSTRKQDYFITSVYLVFIVELIVNLVNYFPIFSTNRVDMYWFRYFVFLVWL